MGAPDSSSSEEEQRKRTSSVLSLAKDGSTSFCARFVQIFVVCIFFAGIVGGFCYAILDGESGTGDGGHEFEFRNASGNYTAFWSEFANSGSCVFVKASEFQGGAEEGGGGGENEGVQRVETYWYQDNDLKRIIFRTEKDYVAYVFSDHTFWVNIDDNEEPKFCERDNSLSYEEFIRRLGLFNMIDRHSEIRRITHNKRVFVYDGEPSVHPLRNFSDIAYYVRAYADYESGALLGWDTFYGSKSISGVEHSQCWFDAMVNGKPPGHIWDLVPTICR